jgi:hypothetical protein
MGFFCASANSILILLPILPHEKVQNLDFGGGFPSGCTVLTLVGLEIVSIDQFDFWILLLEGYDAFQRLLCLLKIARIGPRPYGCIELILCVACIAGKKDLTFSTVDEI